MKLRNLGMLVALTLVFAGCSREATHSYQPPTTPTPNPNAGVYSVYALQDDSSQSHPEPGTLVRLEGLIVTAVVDNDERTHFFASERDGGPFSGIYFFDQHDVTPDALLMGDLVDVTGVYEEDDGLSRVTLNNEDGHVEIRDNGHELPSYALTAAELGELGTDGSLAEPLEGVLLHIEGALTVRNANLNPYGEFIVSNGTDDLVVDDMIYLDADYGRFAGQEIASLSGVFHYSFESYKIEPRHPGDIPGDVWPVLGVHEIQDPTSATRPSLGTNVVISDVIVTAVQPEVDGRRSFFVGEPESGPYSGIYIYDQDMIAPADLAVGDEVTLRGAYTEYFDRTEILLTAGAGLVMVTDTDQAVPRVELSQKDLGLVAVAGAIAESYEGVLIEVVVDPAAPMQVLWGPNAFGEFAVTNSVDQLRIDDMLHPDSESGIEAGMTVHTLWGVLDYSFGNFKLAPRGSTDLDIQL